MYFYIKGIILFWNLFCHLLYHKHFTMPLNVLLYSNYQNLIFYQNYLRVVVKKIFP